MPHWRDNKLSRLTLPEIDEAIRSATMAAKKEADDHGLPAMGIDGSGGLTNWVLPKQIPPAAVNRWEIFGWLITSISLLGLALLAFKWCTG